MPDSLTWAPSSRGGYLSVLTSWPGLLIGLLLYVAYMYYSHLPNPIPGDIPYYAPSRKRLLGDVAELRKYFGSGKYRRFYGDRNRSLQTPISQIFLFPYKKPLVLITDIREATDIVSRRHREFDRSQRTCDIFGIVARDFHLAMTTRNPKFRGNKEILRDLMTPSFLDAVSGPHIHAIATSLVDMWKLKVARAGGVPFSGYDDLHHAAIDIIMAAAFGISDEDSATNAQLRHLQTRSDEQSKPAKVNGADIVEFSALPLPPAYQAVMDATETVLIGLTSPFPAFHHWVLRNTVWRRTFKLKENLIDSEIQKGIERLLGKDKEAVKEDCAMDRMILREVHLAEKEGRRPDFFQPRMRDELFGYIAAGHDTSSTTMAWMVKFLADNQDAQARLRRQLRLSFLTAYTQDRHPTITEITKTSVPYLDAFQEEVLRLAETVPMVMRETIADTMILGHHVPEGTGILLYCHGPGGQTEPAFPIPESLRSEGERNAKEHIPQWEQSTATSFQPERWLKRRSPDSSSSSPALLFVTPTELDNRSRTDEFADLEYDSQAGPFFTFGGGPRGCFGRKLAYLELRVMLAMLVWNFEFETCPAGLSSYEGIDKATAIPKYCYVKLKLAK